MKFILLITLWFMLGSQTVNDKLVVICKHGNNIIVDYGDSLKGIISIKTEYKRDTMRLAISVSKVDRAKAYEIPLPSNIHFVQYGTVTKEVDKLDTCSGAKVLSGKEALEYLKQN